MHDVLIIGGGPAGLACAITLASASQKQWFGDRRIHVLDAGGSDLERAMLHNAPGIEPGTPGPTVLAQMRTQLLQWDAGTIETQHVARISLDPMSATTAAGDTHTARTMVLATGYRAMEIEGVPMEPVAHHRDGRPGRIRLPHGDCWTIAPDLHVAGLLAGGASQFAIAAGIGTQVAVEILCLWAGKRTHIHDTLPAP